MLRGSRDFLSLAEYAQFLQDLFVQRNAGRRAQAGRRVGGHGGVAGATDGVGQTGAGDGGLGQSDPCGAERVFG